jgi:hypothetical protein
MDKGEDESMWDKAEPGMFLPSIVNKKPSSTVIVAFVLAVGIRPNNSSHNDGPRAWSFHD